MHKFITAMSTLTREHSISSVEDGGQMRAHKLVEGGLAPKLLADGREDCRTVCPIMGPKMRVADQA